MRISTAGFWPRCWRNCPSWARSPCWWPLTIPLRWPSAPTRRIRCLICCTAPRRRRRAGRLGSPKPRPGRRDVSSSPDTRCCPGCWGAELTKQGGAKHRMVLRPSACQRSIGGKGRCGARRARRAGNRLGALAPRSPLRVERSGSPARQYWRAGQPVKEVAERRLFW